MDFIFGIRTTIEALKTGKEINKILLKKGMEKELKQDILSLIMEKDIPMQYVPVEKLNRLTQKNHQGVITFISPVEYVKLEQLIPHLFEQGKTPFILILDSITDIRNFGGIARSAECGGVDAIIVPYQNTAQIGGDAVKTSAGALLKMPVCREKNLIKAVKYLKESGIQTIATSEKEEKNYTKLDYSLPTAIIMGSEDKGVSTSLKNISDEQVKIPIIGEIASLNVSASAAIIIYEVVRQRTTTI